MIIWTKCRLRSSLFAKGSHNIQKKVLGACREMLADYKVPSEVRLIDELPKILFGKIAKITLRRQLAEGNRILPRNIGIQSLVEN